MRQSMTLAAVALGAAGPALAQGDDGEWKSTVQVSIAGSFVESEDPAAPAAEGLMASALLRVSRSDTFDSGLTLGWVGAVRYDRDAPSRPAFSGAFGLCPGTSPGCPSSGSLAPVAPATGLSVGGTVRQDDGFVAVETAAVTLGGPWGEGSLGLDSGVAALLDARAPSVLNRVSAYSPGLDPTGLSVTRARNDVTGASAKASYLSPRWLGIRVGVSYTPEASGRTADFDPDVGGQGLAGAELENVWEGAVSFARQFAEQNLRVRAALTYISADSGSGAPGFGDYEAWGGGLELEGEGWTGGARWLSSNNALAAGGGDYEAWEMGFVRQTEDGWRFGLEAGWAEDRLLELEGSSWLAGVAREISDNITLGVAWTVSEADIPVPIGVSNGHRNASNDGLLVEFTVRN